MFKLQNCDSVRSTLKCFLVLFACLAITTVNAEEVDGSILTPISSSSVGGYVWNSSVWQFSGYQSVFQASLMPAGPGGVEAVGVGVFFIPANIETERVTVGFGVAVDTQDMEWAEGRISGGGTAWAFDLGPATFRDGVTFYSGTTDMVTHQLEDVIAGRTQFEIINRPFYDSLQGEIAAVPEPPLTVLLAFGMIVLAIPRLGSFLKKKLGN